MEPGTRAIQRPLLSRGFARVYLQPWRLQLLLRQVGDWILQRKTAHMDPLPEYLIRSEPWYRRHCLSSPRVLTHWDVHF